MSSIENVQAHSKEELMNRDRLGMSPANRQRPDRLTGTLYNQFYSTNPEASPVKPLPINIEDQIVNLENIQKKKRAYVDRLVQNRCIARDEAIDNKTRAVKQQRSQANQVVRQLNLEDAKKR